MGSSAGFLSSPAPPPPPPSSLDLVEQQREWPVLTTVQLRLGREEETILCVWCRDGKASDWLFPHAHNLCSNSANTEEYIEDEEDDPELQEQLAPQSPVL